MLIYTILIMGIGLAVIAMIIEATQGQKSGVWLVLYVILGLIGATIGAFTGFGDAPFLLKYNFLNSLSLALAVSAALVLAGLALHNRSGLKDEDKSWKRVMPVYLGVVFVLLIPTLYYNPLAPDKTGKDLPCDGSPDVCLKEITCDDGFVAEAIEVCGRVQVQCITTPCDPVEETFANMCEARDRGAFDIRKGSCESAGSDTQTFKTTQGNVSYTIYFPGSWVAYDNGRSVIFSPNPNLEIPAGTEGYAIGSNFSISVNNITDSQAVSYEEWLDLYGLTAQSPLFVKSSDENINGYQMKRVITEAAGAEGQVLQYVFFVDIQRILTMSQYPFAPETDTTKVFEQAVRTFRLEDMNKGRVPVNSGDLIQTTCQKSTDCPIAVDYAVRSNCPYGSACIDGACAVICPMWEHSPNPEESISYQVKCSKDIDCDCSVWDSEEKYDCVCADGQCASIVLSNK